MPKPRTAAETAEIDKMMARGFKKLFFKSQWNHNTAVASAATATFIQGKSMTQVHQLEETEINAIMKKFGVTGVAPGARRPPVFMDIPDDLDMRSAIDLVREGYQTFESQPAEIRAMFKNDMASYVTTVEGLRKAGNWEALAQLGILNADERASYAAKANPPPEPKVPNTPDGGKKEPPAPKD